MQVFCFRQITWVRCSSLSRTFKMLAPYQENKAGKKPGLDWCFIPMLFGGEVLLQSAFVSHRIHNSVAGSFTSECWYINATHGMNYWGPSSVTLTDTGIASEKEPWFCKDLQKHSIFFLWQVSVSKRWLLQIFLEVWPILVLLTAKGDRIHRNFCLCYKL